MNIWVVHFIPNKDAGSENANDSCNVCVNALRIAVSREQDPVREDFFICCQGRQHNVSPDQNEGIMVNNLRGTAIDRTDGESWVCVERFTI